MSSVFDRIRARREAARRDRAIESALRRSAGSPAMRDEILTIINR